MNLDATHLMKKSDIMLDTYVDRSFHWGKDILEHIGLLPYTRNWYGFIHHTFDRTHSEYNCYELIQNPLFIESLRYCKGLLVMSQYLVNQLKASLNQIGIDVPINMLYHPTEFVDNTFTMQKFLNNPNKSIVQIGAWLRNPYAIYELPIPQDGGPLSLKKKALKGKEMDQYFPPPGLLESIENVLLDMEWEYSNATSGQVCGNHICRDQLCSHICRSHGNASINKYCKGLYDMVIRHIDSVEVVERLSNDAYDILLSENIVFLNLVDCSAVNTVIECIVRNSVLVVNRLPAIVEILGKDYPGFYNTLVEAAEICSNVNKINTIHMYMLRLDKERYRLENFVNQMQDIIQDGKSYVLYDLFQPPPKNIFQNKYTNIMRYLPVRFH